MKSLHKTEKEYYWLAVDGHTIPQWKKPHTPEGKRAVFKLMRKKSSELALKEKETGAHLVDKFEIFSSRRDKSLWESGRWDVIVEMEMEVEQ